VLALVIAGSASAVTMDWTPIGNPGNACDLQAGVGCFGAVPYSYSIGTYEVTNAQYAEFLNSKAGTDPLGLYDPNMGNPVPGSSGYGGIARSGNAGSYTYTAIAGRENMPVNWVSFYDSVRFANWMNNGQGGGDTETGAYTLLGGTPNPSNNWQITRNQGAAIAISSENEWFKAAYYDASTLSYFAYPAGSSVATTCSGPSTTPNTANCGAGFTHQGDFTPVGAYVVSASPYGTFDQGGNAIEWNETLLTQIPAGLSDRRLKGGSFQEISSLFNKTLCCSIGAYAEFGSYNRGFRLVLIPEPSTGLLVAVGLIGIALRRRLPA